MALRLSARRASALLPRCTSARAAASAPLRRGNATVADKVKGSNLPPEVLASIQHDASLPNPDPHAESQTAHLVSSQSPYMVPTYVRPPPMFEKGEGCWLYDLENRRYLDFTAGIAVNSLGHCDPGVTATMAAQAATLVHSSNLYHNPWTGLLSQRLVELTRELGGMQHAARAFIANSGSEANEAAIKFARKVGRTRDPSGAKHRLLSFHSSFHGRTMGSLSATPNPKYQAPFGPMLPGFDYAPYNDIDAATALITDATCGVLVEPIQGEGGVHVATPAFLTALRAACDRVGAVLIYDEIQCGLARTGDFWAHAALPPAAHPDILTTAKALGNGFPIGATLVTQPVSDAIATGDHGTTFGGNPLGARVAHHILGRLAAPELRAAVRAREQQFRARLAPLQRRFPREVREVRGRGLILGLQLSVDPTPIVTAARERGLLVITCGSNTLRFVPPLVVSAAEVDEGMDILERAMESVWVRGEAVEGTRGQQEMGRGATAEAR